MAVADEKSGPDGKVWTLCSMPFWQNSNAPSSASSSSVIHRVHLQSNGHGHKPAEHSSSHPGVVSSIAKSLLPTKRRLRLDPSNKLYFPCMSPVALFSCAWLIFCLMGYIVFGLFIRFSVSLIKVVDCSSGSLYFWVHNEILLPFRSVLLTVFGF